MSKEYIFAKHNRSIEKRATKKRKPAETVQQTKCIKKTQQNSNTHICPKKNSNSAKKRRQKADNQDFVLYRPNTNGTNQQEQKTHKNDRTVTAENTAENKQQKSNTLRTAEKNKNKRKNRARKQKAKQKKNVGDRTSAHLSRPPRTQHKQRFTVASGHTNKQHKPRRCLPQEICQRIANQLTVEF